MWKLTVDRGRQVWNYDPNEKPNAALSVPFDNQTQPNSADLVYRSSKLGYIFPPPKTDEKPGASIVESANAKLHHAISFYQQLQSEDGHWPADYGGPLFLMPGLVIACYASNTPIEECRKKEMLRYIFNHQNADGGWGLHIESKSTIFGSALNYVTARILGASADDERCKRGRDFIKRHGGAIGIPSWGKFWLAVLGVYDWTGMDTLLPELWLLPEWLPIHPWRYWCHCRMVYLPMAYVYGQRITAPHSPLIDALREELYVQKYETINWPSARANVAPIDIYNPRAKILGVLNYFLNIYESWHLSLLRKWASNFIVEYIQAEDEQTKYVDIGPVNKVINFLSVWHARGKDSAEYKMHVDRLLDYLWIAEDGMKMQGYNGSQLWDLTFAVQGILDKYAHGKKDDIPTKYRACLRKAYHFLETTQVLEDVPKRERFYRHISKGGWPFSTRDHGWPISDCTAEGLSTALLLHSVPGLIVDENKKIIQLDGDEPLQLIDDSRLFDAVNVILSFQNEDGGWATYENTRGSPHLELLNPSDVFGAIMIDYSYTECTSASVRALLNFAKIYPTHRAAEIKESVRRGVQLIKSKQREDGSWYGSWAVCFTYGTWFGVEGLIAAGEPKNSPTIQKACQFLVDHQNADGGWGEDSRSCSEKKWVNSQSSHAVNTGWALLTLLAADYPNRSVIEKGVKFLIERQQSDGDWAQEGISGVFNANCMITYTAYRNVFPIWALNRFTLHYGS
eukprot:TRINITY_DN7614_c0_g4_i1.p1 TRINITY_DN7614_c0_g4~~TRINITY_DN7614_c0_g4_i1.p1  ORF type:complete len:737 (-),score=182.30 TRINITY_DN7614_c0_g4_i1:86-2296(-)